MKRPLVAAAAILSAALLGFDPLRAEMRKGAIELGAYVFRANFDSDSNIENDEGFGARLGILFTEQHELEFSYDHLSTEDEFFGGDVDLDTFKAGYVYNFLPDSAVSPFITVGGGLQRLEFVVEDLLGFEDEVDETDPLAFGGGGVRFFIGNVFNIRADAQIVAVFPDDDPDDTLIDGLLQAGVGWIIGG
ncbi:MAG TPA: outer membrane beta-barrel protein [Candidatus Polarisedimenticolia bacterium]|nr:outer membrane beta-barrel protein [Candidatus Polarisedimenticolia bacterium]